MIRSFPDIGEADRQGHGDLSTRGGLCKSAERAIAGFDRYGTAAIVIDVNQGGDMVRHTLERVRPSLPISEIPASRGF